MTSLYKQYGQARANYIASYVILAIQKSMDRGLLEGKPLPEGAVAEATEIVAAGVRLMGWGTLSEKETQHGMLAVQAVNGDIFATGKGMAAVDFSRMQQGAGRG